MHFILTQVYTELSSNIKNRSEVLGYVDKMFFSSGAFPPVLITRSLSNQ